MIAYVLDLLMVQVTNLVICIKKLKKGKMYFVIWQNQHNYNMVMQNHSIWQITKLFYL